MASVQHHIYCESQFKIKDPKPWIREWKLRICNQEIRFCIWESLWVTLFSSLLLSVLKPSLSSNCHSDLRYFCFQFQFWKVSCWCQFSTTSIYLGEAGLSWDLVAHWLLNHTALTSASERLTSAEKCVSFRWSAHSWNYPASMYF